MKQLTEQQNKHTHLTTNKLQTAAALLISVLDENFQIM